MDLYTAATHLGVLPGITCATDLEILSHPVVVEAIEAARKGERSRIIAWLRTHNLISIWRERVGGTIIGDAIADAIEKEPTP